MAQNTTITVGTTYTQLTDADVTAISLQNQSDFELEVTAVASGTPAETVPGVKYLPRTGDDNLTLADRFLGVTGPVRVWARSLGPGATVWVNHA